MYHILITTQYSAMGSGASVHTIVVAFPTGVEAIQAIEAITQDGQLRNGNVTQRAIPLWRD